MDAKKFDPNKTYNDIRVWTTHACNSKCDFCFADADEPMENELTFPEMKKFLDKFGTQLKVFTFTGGEPLLRPKYVNELNQYLKEKKVKTRMFTNGFLINNINPKDFDIIQISLESANPEIHDKIRGVPGAFDKAINAINFVNTKADLWIRTTITSLNYTEIKKLLDLCQKWGVKKWWTRPVIQVRRGERAKYIPSKEQIKTAIDEIKSLKNDYKMEISLLANCDPKMVSDPRDEMCPDLLILPNGDLYNCSFDTTLLGNLREYI